MSRDDLIATNAGIVKSVTENVVKYSPDAKIIVVSNPLDVMTYCAYLTAKIDSSKVFGMAGILDTARYQCIPGRSIGYFTEKRSRPCYWVDMVILWFHCHGIRL